MLSIGWDRRVRLLIGTFGEHKERRGLSPSKSAA
jgi:hypothetical protein